MKKPDYEQLYRKTSSDGIEEYYIKHVDAMTREGLRSKCEIALELAARDAEIHRLKLEIENLEILYARDTAIRKANEVPK